MTVAMSMSMKAACVLVAGLAFSLALDFSEVAVGLEGERGWVAAYADFDADKATDVLLVSNSSSGMCVYTVYIYIVSIVSVRS